jgi:hypothetical protein
VGEMSAVNLGGGESGQTFFICRVSCPEYPSLVFAVFF